MYSSDAFGRIFWIDEDLEFKSCPLNVDNTGDFDHWDYVSEWSDWEGVDMSLHSISEGRGIEKLKELVEYSQSL